MNGAFLRTLGQGLLQQHHQQQLQLGERDKDEECCRPTELSAEESEGFSRSISLYWRWCKGQKGASRVGKVSVRRRMASDGMRHSCGDACPTPNTPTASSHR